MALLAEAESIRELLMRNREELSGMLGALEGGWVAPEAGGDLLRDGPGVLPTGGSLCEVTGTILIDVVPILIDA